MNIILHLFISWILLASYVFNSTYNLYINREYCKYNNCSSIYREYLFDIFIVLVLLLILNLIDKLNEFLIETDKKVIQLGTRVEENII